jgi:hypothetical protein
MKPAACRYYDREALGGKGSRTAVSEWYFGFGTAARPQPNKGSDMKRTGDGSRKAQA